jgi:hypothetical protein
MEILCKRNTALTVFFPMIVRDAADFATSGDWTPVGADCQFSKDGAAFGNTNSAPAYEGQGIWSLALLGSEVDGLKTVISIVDSATKAVEDQALILATYGDSSAQHKFDGLVDFIWRRSFGNIRTSSDGETPSFRSGLGLLAKMVNRVHPSGSNLLITQEDDSTTFGTQVMTTSAAADPITELDTQ